MKRLLHVLMYLVGYSTWVMVKMGITDVSMQKDLICHSTYINAKGHCRSFYLYQGQRNLYVILLVARQKGIAGHSICINSKITLYVILCVSRQKGSVGHSICAKTKGPYMSGQIYLISYAFHLCQSKRTLCHSACIKVKGPYVNLLV